MFDYARDDNLSDAIASRGGFRAVAPSRGDADDYWYAPFSTPSVTGINVNAESAMRLSAVYRCVSILAGTLASLPLELYKGEPNGQKEDADDHPLSDLFANSPNSWQTIFEFIETMEAHRTLRGNAIAQILPGPRGAIDQLIPIHPDRVTINRLDNGRIGYEVQMPDGSRKRLTQDEVMHIRGLSFDGIRGVNPIEYQRETIGVGLAGQQFAARFFANDGTPGGILTHPGVLTEQARDNLRKSFRQSHVGVANSHNMLIAEEGMTYTQMGINNRDAQFIETQRYSLGDIARMFGVPMHMINELDRATFSNIEQQSLEFVRDTIRPNCERWEAVIYRDLIKPLEEVGYVGYFAEFNLDSLLRADFKTRMDGYAVQIRNHLATPDECRAQENMNRIADGSGAKYYRSADLMSDDEAQSKAENAATGATRPDSGAPTRSDPATSTDASLVTVKIPRAIALALNGSAHWENADGAE